MTRHDKLGDAYAKLKSDYPGIHNTAIEFREARNVVLNILSRDTKIDKTAIAHFLNEHTILKYDLRKRQDKNSDR